MGSPFRIQGRGLSRRTEVLGFVVGAVIVILVLGSVIVSYNNTVGGLRAQLDAENRTAQQLLAGVNVMVNDSPYSIGQLVFLVPSTPPSTPGLEWGSSLSEAFVFNCASEAASASGCTRPVPYGNGTYYATAWFPFVDQNNTYMQVNCKVSYLAIYGPSTLEGYCIPLNLTAFVVGELNSFIVPTSLGG
jgi:hypothetical protein